jgi:hypothetical protein
MTDDFDPDERWFAHLLASVPTPASLDRWGEEESADTSRKVQRGRLTPALTWGVALAVVSGVITGVGLMGPNLHRGGGSTTSDSASAPSPRSQAGLADDDVHQFVVLFGGRSGSGTGLLGDTWTWDGRRWSERHPTHSPSPRSAAAMSSDPDGGGVLLVGGVGPDGRVLSDDWEWNGQDWQPLPGQTGPVRAGAVMTFDPIAGHIVLVGGQAGAADRPTTTWVRAGGVWEARLVDPAPPACTAAAMAYDDAVREVVLVTGRGCEPQPATWTWDGHAWTRLSALPQPPAGGFTVAYDEGSQRLVMFSPGTDTAHPCAGRVTSTWDGFTWTPVSPGMAPAAAATAVLDPVARKPLLLTVTGETWRWDGAGWGIVGAATSAAGGQSPLCPPPGGAVH